MPFNLSSPNALIGPCDLHNLESWFEREMTLLKTPAERRVLALVVANLNNFIRWPKEALLLWPGCDRVAEPGKQKYFSYPRHLKHLASTAAIPLDTRANGPAVLAFRRAGGDRPNRYGSSNAWSVHHIYSGKFPYIGKTTTLHAAKHPNHFTQSACLVAAHPVADALVDEFPFFTWFLRAHAYTHFGYDPDCAFSTQVDEFGFVSDRSCRVVSAA